MEIAVQVNGKVKARLKVAADITAEDAIAAAKADPAVADALAGKTVVKEIYVKGRLVNLAVKRLKFLQKNFQKKVDERMKMRYTVYC